MTFQTKLELSSKYQLDMALIVKIIAFFDILLVYWLQTVLHSFLSKPCLCELTACSALVILASHATLYCVVTTEPVY